MLDHLGITVLDFERSVAFYKKALAPLSITVIKELTAADTGANAHVGFGCEGKPFFWISDAAQPRGILHIAFRAANRSAVEAFYRAALAAGGRDNGPPGPANTTTPITSGPSSSILTATTSRPSATSLGSAAPVIAPRDSLAEVPVLPHPSQIINHMRHRWYNLPRRDS
jgi:catechol 2,3-dioxygenase-like lactoylglutathione lyase family enzyme